MVCTQTKSCTVKPTDRSPVFVLFDLTSYLPVGIVRRSSVYGRHGRREASLLPIIPFIFKFQKNFLRSVSSVVEKQH